MGGLSGACRYAHEPHFTHHSTFGHHKRYNLTNADPESDNGEVTARGLFSLVLTEARLTLDRSPEQVEAAVGVSGRTIRRLEDPASDMSPRGTTLAAVANFYA